MKSRKYAQNCAVLESTIVWNDSGSFGIAAQPLLGNHQWMVGGSDGKRSVVGPQVGSKSQWWIGGGSVDRRRSALGRRIVGQRQGLGVAVGSWRWQAGGLCGMAMVFHYG